MTPLFDFVSLMFSNDQRWKALADNDKNGNYFMMTRFISINYPVQAQTFNHMKINPSNVMDIWHRILPLKHGNKVPHWVYAKTKKKAKEKAKKTVSLATIKWYCEKEEISQADYAQKLKFFGDDFEAEMISLEKNLKTQGVI